MITIPNRWTGKPIYVSATATTVAEAVAEMYVKHLSFYEANLVGANLARANLVGANLDGATLVGANLARANLVGATLVGANLARATLDGANLDGANLARANLVGANLDGATLDGANLDGATLVGANLARALPDYIPRVPMLHTRILQAIEAGGALEMGGWHDDKVGQDGSYCGTTHCRAGWAIALAGVGGRVLEGVLGPSAAGALISIASCPQLEGKVPNFYAENNEALEDIRRVAALEQAAAAAKATE